MPAASPVVYRCTVPGQPVPKARARTFLARNGRMRSITPARTKAAEENVGWHAKLAWRQEPDATSRFGLRLGFYLGNDRRVDTDNLTKLVKDALIGVVYGDDSQVVEEHAQKWTDREEPRTEIEVWRA